MNSTFRFLSEKNCDKMVATFTCRVLYEFLCSLLIAYVTLTSTAFLSVPKDSVAVVGARVLLECRTSRLNLSLRWSYYASNNPKRLVSLYNGRSVSNAFASNYEVDAIPDSGSYNLIIKSAGFPCAGEYTCSEDPFAQNATVAFLTVLASDPVCDTNVKHVIHGMPKVENGELWAWCTVTSIGKGIPGIKWTFDSAGIVKSNETVTVNSTGSVSTFTSTIKMQVNSSAYGMIIRCKTIFEIQELPERLHYNQTLNYEYTWNITENALCGSDAIPEIFKISKKVGEAIILQFPCRNNDCDFHCYDETKRRYIAICDGKKCLNDDYHPFYEEGYLIINGTVKTARSCSLINFHTDCVIFDLQVTLESVPANWSSSSSSNSTGTPVSKVLVPISAIVIFIVVAAVLFKYHQKIKNAVINCYQRIKNRNKELDGNGTQNSNGSNVSLQSVAAE